MPTTLEPYLEVIWSEDDVPTVIEAQEKLVSLARKEDLAELVAALRSDRNNFWTRELISEPIAYLGGAEYLLELLEAMEKNRMDGHDNDSLEHFVIEIADLHPVECRAKLEELKHNSPAIYEGYSNWLLEFCQ